MGTHESETGLKVVQLRSATFRRTSHPKRVRRDRGRSTTSTKRRQSVRLNKEGHLFKLLDNSKHLRNIAIPGIKERCPQDDCSTTETTSTNNVGPVDVSSSGGCVLDANVTGECSSKTTTFKEDVNVPVVSTSDHCTLQADVTGVANNVPASDPVTCDMNPTGLQRPTGPPVGYVHLGTCDQTYQHCGARFQFIRLNGENAVAHIYLQLNQTTKAHEALKKAIRIDPRDPEAFLDLGELLISTDSRAALEAFKTVRNLLKKSNEEVSVELLNNIGVLHFEKGEFELAKQTFKEALGDGIWVKLIESEPQSDSIGASDDPIQKALNQPMDAIELPWDKITTLSNLARLFEQLHKTETASLLYRLILFKFPEYVDAYLRLAAIAKARNNVPLSIEPNLLAALYYKKSLATQEMIRRSGRIEQMFNHIIREKGKRWEEVCV
ncbi:protein CTR9 [Tanacetum coccineum]